MRPKILFPDQNKWIELAREKSLWSSAQRHACIFDQLVRYVQEGKLLVPLTASNIYETLKRNDPVSRSTLAFCQATLSGGLVIKNGTAQRRIQLREFFGRLGDRTATQPSSENVISDFFPDAFADQEDLGLQEGDLETALAISKMDPRIALFSYMTQASNEHRKIAVENYSRSSQKMISEINSRIQGLKSEPTGTRRRFYQAILAYDHQDQILREADRHGITKAKLTDKNGKLLRKVIRELDYFRIETELTLKIEGRNKKIAENELRDLQNATTTIPICDLIVLEKDFSSLIEQCSIVQGSVPKITCSLSSLVDHI
ncbi:MAG: hypothetical protein U1E15_13200 [Hyphomicrobiales bacterium]